LIDLSTWKKKEKIAAIRPAVPKPKMKAKTKPVSNVLERSSMDDVARQEASRGPVPSSVGPINKTDDDDDDDEDSSDSDAPVFSVLKKHKKPQDATKLKLKPTPQRGGQGEVVANSLFHSIERAGRLSLSGEMDVQLTKTKGNPFKKAAAAAKKTFAL
jgi:hypothetical protein